MIFAGRGVHEAHGVLELVAKMGTVPAPKLRDVAPHASMPFARVVDGAVAFHRADRYADATSMRADVQAALASIAGAAVAPAGPVSTPGLPLASPASTRAGGMRQARQHPVPATAPPRGARTWFRRHLLFFSSVPFVAARGSRSARGGEPHRGVVPGRIRGTDERRRADDARASGPRRVTALADADAHVGGILRSSTPRSAAKPAGCGLDAGALDMSDAGEEERRTRKTATTAVRRSSPRSTPSSASGSRVASRSAKHAKPVPRTVKRPLKSLSARAPPRREALERLRFEAPSVGDLRATDDHSRPRAAAMIELGEDRAARSLVDRRGIGKEAKVSAACVDEARVDVLNVPAAGTA